MRPLARPLSGSIAVLSLVVVSVGLATPETASAATSPSGLAVQHAGSSTPVFTWKRVASATTYEIQVDNDPGFGSPEFSTSTVNSRAVPAQPLPPGKDFWRVRAVTGKGPSSWASSTTDVSPVTVPVPISPADGAHLAQPQSAPLLQWEAAKGATYYKVEVDGDSDFIGSKSYQTRTTSLVIPDALLAGDYFWRVTAFTAGGFNSAASPALSFFIDPLATPARTFPPDNIDYAIEDVVLDWNPVPGARTYDLQVAVDSEFQNITLNVQGLVGTRYSPATTLNNDQFWWRVRAVDSNGQPTPWAPSVNNFKRQWPDQAQPLYPTGAVATDGAEFFQWTPVQHATFYQLTAATDANFNNVFLNASTAGTTYTNRASDLFPTGIFYWKVRPIDTPYGGGLPGVYGPTQMASFAGRTAPTSINGSENTPVTGQKVAATGLGVFDGAKGCTQTLCNNIPQTPVFRWDKMPGITGYRVWFAVDENFTTVDAFSTGGIYTQRNYLTINMGDPKSQLPESQAGQPWFWYVQPCTDNACGASPVSTPSVLPGTYSFGKRSPAVVGLTNSDPSANDISLSWEDYATTNANTSWNGETMTQTARQYRVQVATDTTFGSTVIDDATVDQTTYTSPSRLYPEGTLYWRVQALDEPGNFLTWSQTASFVKSTPPVALQSPVNGAATSGTAPLRWAPQAFASEYQVEVYRNADTTYSATNRVFSANVRTAAYAWDSIIPASDTPYVWRVRRIDTSGNPGPWSTPGTFVSLGAAPTLVTPGKGANKRGNDIYLEWTEAPDATSYRVDLNAGKGNRSAIDTTATAYAATSWLETDTYSWTVTAYNANGQALGTSAPGQFSADSTAPTVRKYGPQQLKPRSVIKVTFSERVKGVSKKTVYLARAVQGPKKVKYVKQQAKVKVLKKGRGLSLKTKKRIKPGSYLLFFKTDKITDAVGNPLVAANSGFQRRTSGS